ncbi:MAG: hypothetical protein HC802_11135 [Caldilineaceae bacterium]|nr:hypothetical protein [Caldilineaceae bacterium]
MTLRHWWDTTFAGELLLLAMAAPLLYFPARFPSWTVYVAIGLLSAGWIWRRRRLGIWFQRTPADWPVFFLLLVMLPVSLWAAPEPLRNQYSIPKAYILIWNFFLFWTIVTHASRSWALDWVAIAGFIAAGTLIALVAPLGIDWLYKYPGIDAVLSRVPSPLVGVFRGADSGFHPNQVAGTLLYVLPLLLALTAASIYRLHRARVRHKRDWALALLLVACSVVMGGVFLLTQSRSGLAGITAGVMVMILVNWRWGRWALLAGSAALLATMFIMPSTMLQLIADAHRWKPRAAVER